MGTKWKDDRKGYKYLLVPDLFNRFVYWMIEYGLFTPGIFRSTSVNTSLVSQIQESIENSFDYTIPPTATPIEIASLLSLYLRELPFPIIDLKTIDPLERNLLPFPLFPLFLPPLLFFFPLLHSFSVSHSPSFHSLSSFFLSLSSYLFLQTYPYSFLLCLSLILFLGLSFPLFGFVISQRLFNHSLLLPLSSHTRRRQLVHIERIFFNPSFLLSSYCLSPLFPLLPLSSSLCFLSSLPIASSLLPFSDLCLPFPLLPLTLSPLFFFLLSPFPIPFSFLISPVL